eukprot:58121-Chlamydomonas_euryale.AAC.1
MAATTVGVRGAAKVAHVVPIAKCVVHDEEVGHRDAITHVIDLQAAKAASPDAACARWRVGNREAVEWRRAQRLCKVYQQGASGLVRLWRRRWVVHTVVVHTKLCTDKARWRRRRR